MYQYKTKGTCSQMIYFDLEDNKVKSVQFMGGCNGNLKGIAALVEGMDIDEATGKEILDIEKRCKNFKNKADFVEVPYRCETCKRKKGKVNECGDVYCILHKGYFDRDAFCSYGERGD